MTSISIIGSGNMAAALGTSAVRHGHTAELMSRDPARARALADRIGDGARVGTYGARPAGDIVVVAVLFAAAWASLVLVGLAGNGAAFDLALAAEAV